MAPKKVQKNGFYCFSMEFREDQEQKGIEMPRGLKELMEITKGPWNKLSPDQKAYYNNQAKMVNGQRDKMDCTGRLLKDIERENREKKEKEDKMTEYISMSIRSLGDKSNVSLEKFYVIQFNIFCKTSNDMYLPAEVGLVEFNLHDGILNSYHSFIDPGTIPLGYSYECKSQSEQTHKIPWINFDKAEKDYSKIANDIIDLIDPDHDLPSYPMLYCHVNEMDQSKALIDLLMQGLSRRVDFAVLDIAQLFYELYCFAKDDMISVGLLRDRLKDSAYSYAENTSCDWHWDSECIDHCALNIAKRSCFLMFDVLCPLYGIQIIPNKHVPVSTHLPITPMSSERYSSASSFRTNSSMSETNFQSDNDSYYSGQSNAPSRSHRGPWRNDDRHSNTNSYPPSVGSGVWDQEEPSYITPSASPQYASAFSQSGSTSWKSAREPRTQSFSEAAASNSSGQMNDFQMNNSNFPSLGRGGGGARPKQSQQQFQRYEGNNDPRSAAASRTSSALSDYSQTGSGYGRGRWQYEQ